MIRASEIAKCCSDVDEVLMLVAALSSMRYARHAPNRTARLA